MRYLIIYFILFALCVQEFWALVEIFRKEELSFRFEIVPPTINGFHEKHGELDSILDFILFSLNQIHVNAFWKRPITRKQKNGNLLVFACSYQHHHHLFLILFFA